MPSEGVMLTRIAIDCRVWFAGKCLLDLSLRRLGNELVLLGQVHQQRRIKTVDLAQIFLSVTAVISDRGVDAVARSRQEGQIGRASCRERVEITVVGVVLKK